MRWYLLTAVASLFVILAVTGAWRIALRPFRIDARAMSPAALGFQIADPTDLDRVDGICRAFAGGFNAMITAPKWQTWSRNTDRQEVFYRPFADEGAAMGFALRKLGRFTPAGFESAVVAQRPAYRYLHYVGLGFWSAMRDHPPRHIERLIAGLDPLHGMLCLDGYGFKFGFFDFEVAALRDRFAQLPGYARNVAYQGLGRSLWFRFMGSPERLIENIGVFDRYANDVAAGIGLAVVFTTIDRPRRGFDVLDRIPSVWRDDVQLGMCFAYKARSLNDPERFERQVDSLESSRRAAVRGAVQQCDAIEAVVRADGAADGYRRWRESLREWLREQIEYPFVTHKKSRPARRDAAPAPA